MALLIIFMVVCFLVGLVLSFGPAFVEQVLSFGTNIETVSVETVITTVVMIGVLILLWGLNALVSKEDSWIYRDVVTDGNEVKFYNVTKKAINIAMLAIIVVYSVIVIVMCLEQGIESALSAVKAWRVEYTALLANLNWVGNMLMAAGIAFAISLAVINSDPKWRRMQKRKASTASKGSALKVVVTPKESEEEAGT